MMHSRYSPMMRSSLQVNPACGRFHARGGFSLMEVMLATAILLGCTVVLVELSNFGRRNSMAALDHATAQTICLTHLNEILTGQVPAITHEATPLEGSPGWTISVQNTPLETEGLSSVTVTAAQEENNLGKLQSYSLTRWIAAEAGGESEPGSGSVAGMGAPSESSGDFVSEPEGSAP